jgi:hypothetical protein
MIKHFTNFCPFFRFGGLNKKCDDRMQLLEEAFGIAKEYHDKFIVLEKWLDKSEKKIKDMEVVPTEEDQIQRRIQEHDKLHTEILGKQPSFDDVADVASALMQVVSEEVNLLLNSSREKRSKTTVFWLNFHENSKKYLLLSSSHFQKSD